MAYDMETVELLADAVARQAALITKLYSVVSQHAYFETLEKEVEEVTALAETALTKGGGTL